jgi:hypothetical protein
METFGNYPVDRPFDPFSVMLFKALQVVAFLFFIALIAMNPETKEGKIDTKAEYIITLTWPDSHPDDIDLYAEDPLGNIVWYHEREAGFMVLDRDDRGGLNNSTVNVNYYLATQPTPVPVTVKIEKVNPHVEVVAYDTVTLEHMGQEKTAARFKIAANGDILDVNHRDKSLIQLTRSVRRSSSAK